MVYDESFLAGGMWGTFRRCAVHWCRQVIPFGPSNDTEQALTEAMAASIADRWSRLGRRNIEALILHAVDWSMPCEQLAARILEHDYPSLQ
jgi:hypothetical protein